MFRWDRLGLNLLLLLRYVSFQTHHNLVQGARVRVSGLQKQCQEHQRDHFLNGSLQIQRKPADLRCTAGPGRAAARQVDLLVARVLGDGAQFLF